MPDRNVGGFLRRDDPDGELGPLVIVPSEGTLAVGGATETTLREVRDQSSDFKRILKFEPVAGEELRADDVAGGDRYHGAAADGTATSAASWRVVRFYRDATGGITRVRYRTGVAWDNRASGW